MVIHALDGVRVLELGEGKALGYCGKLLLDLGAEVLKVEPPDGDALRRYGPFSKDEPDLERSGLFIYLNGGKRAARLELADHSDRAAFDELLSGADVLLHALRPSEAERLELDPGTLLPRLPALVVTAITPYGSTGPYAEWKGYALHASAGGGVTYRIGEPEREPLALPLDGIELHHAAPQAAASTVLALLQRARDGLGQFVDLSVMEAASVAVWGHFIAQSVHLGQPIARRSGVRNSPGRPWGIWPMADGHFNVNTVQQRHWEAFRAELGEPEWAHAPLVHRMGDPLHLRGLTPEDGKRLVETVTRELGPWLRQRTRADLWEISRRLQLPFQPILGVGEVCDSGEAEARGLLVGVPGSRPPLRIPRAPYLFSRTPTRLPGTPPSLVEPSARGWLSEGIRTQSASLPAGPTEQEQPLAAIRVLDLGQVWAGPQLGRYLADFGADVIQVGRGGRSTGTAGSTDVASPMAWEWTHRNRRSLTLDLKHAEAVALFRRLAAVADVMLDNFTPQVMPGFGLDYEELADANPHLIIVAMSASGRTGPWADLRTYGESLAALYGMKSLSGYPEDGRIVEGTAELDPIAAGYAALAIFAALHHRNRTGEGQLIEIAQGEAGFGGIAEAVIEYLWNGRELGPQGNGHRVLAPHGLYRCAGDDQWIAIACAGEAEWEALAHCAGHDEWRARTDFSSAEARRTARVALDQVIGEWTKTHDKRELAATLQSAGVAAFPLLDAIEVVSDPHHALRRRHFRVPPDFPASQLLNGSAWHLSRARPMLRRPTPDLGAHNVEVLGEYLGMPEDEVRRLERLGVLT